MQLAETQWVAFMDGDDVSYPQRLEKQISFLQQYPEQSICAVGSRIKYINETDEIIAGENGTGPTTLQAFKELNQKDKNVIVGIFHSTAIIHRETFYQIGGYREIHTPCSDMDIYARLGETGKAILTVPECLVMYRVHSNALSIDKAFDLRKKHHFTIENTQRRRAGQTELSWEAFLKTRWQKPWYRYPKRRTDWGIILYKKAGLYYGKRRFFRVMGTLFMALLIAPEHVAKRVILQIRTIGH
ncbi:glycosyl transferase family 2 [Candidatus Thiomargarita nelsonii]|uniref:Glycosyl transferase family 2 n=1 Tax=Candidatus Thiomargarita nelsonii TaxID=1003181 RepID=A0A176RV80_9GAMM|nr:glycosyl transferase family 2 [Candidatus Thiomargarita nelsonii]